MECVESGLRDAYSRVSDVLTCIHVSLMWCGRACLLLAAKGSKRNKAEDDDDDD